MAQQHRRDRRKPKSITATGEQYEDFVEDVELNQLTSSERDGSRSFVSARRKTFYITLLLVAIVGATMLVMIPYYARHNKNDSSENSQVDAWMEGDLWDNGNRRPQLRSASTIKQKKLPKDLGQMNIYIRKPTVQDDDNSHFKQIRFPVARYDSTDFHNNGPLLSLTPWAPIFVDQNTQQTLIYSKTGVYMIPPIMNAHGDVHSVGELIKYGHASLGKNRDKSVFPNDISSNFQRKKLNGPGIPQFSSQMGSFSGVLQTNDDHFDIPSYGTRPMGYYSSVQEQDQEQVDAQEQEQDQAEVPEQEQEQEQDQAEVPEQEQEQEQEQDQAEVPEQEQEQEQGLEVKNKLTSNTNSKISSKPQTFNAKHNKLPAGHPLIPGHGSYVPSAHKYIHKFPKDGFSHPFGVCGRFYVDKLKTKYLSSKIPNATKVTVGHDDDGEEVEVDDVTKLDTCNCQQGILKPSVLFEHGLFLILHLTSEDDSSVKAACRQLKKLKESIHLLHPDYTLEVTLGLGYNKAKEWFAQANIPFLKSFIPYRRKFGILKHEMPSTGGDIFIDIRSSRKDLCFELGRRFYQLISPKCIDKLEETFGFGYMSSNTTGLSKDFIGFEDGNDNPEGYIQRSQAALITAEGEDPIHVGGSFAVTQKWFHNLTKWNELSQATQELVIGRSKGDGSIETKPRTAISHVGRTHREEDNGEEIEIVRKSLPHGGVQSHGLFFVAYASNITKHEILLNSMVGNLDGEYDRLMDYTSPVTGNYWYILSKSVYDKLLPPVTN